MDLSQWHLEQPVTSGDWHHVCEMPRPSWNTQGSQHIPQATTHPSCPHQGGFLHSECPPVLPKSR